MISDLIEFGKSNNKNLEKYLTTIFGDLEENELHWFYLSNDPENKICKHKSGLWANERKEIDRRNRKLQFNVHIRPNRYKRFKWLVLDFDIHGNEEDIEIGKRQILAKLSSFDKPPTMVNESRRGYHCFWNIEEGSTDEQFKAATIGLFEDLKEQAGDLYQLDTNCFEKLDIQIRMPGSFYWLEDGTSFKCNVIEHSPKNTYKAEQFAKVKPLCTDENFNHITLIDHPFQGGDCSVSMNIPYSDGMYQSLLIVSTDGNKTKHAECSYQPSMEYRTDESGIRLYDSIEGMTKYYNEQDVAQYLRDKGYMVPSGKQQFHCPFHQDEHPSAAIFYASNHGYYMFTCFAASCPFRNKCLSIVGLEKAFAGEMMWKTLGERYGARLDTEWHQQQTKRIYDNISILDDLSGYPNLKKFIDDWDLLGRLKTVLRSVSSIYKNQQSNVNNNHVFHYTVDRACETLNAAGIEIGRKASAEFLSIISAVGFMVKVPLAKLPEQISNFLLDSKGKQFHKHYAQYFTIPTLTDDVLKQLDHNAEVLLNVGITRSGWCWKILRKLLPEQEYGLLQNAYMQHDETEWEEWNVKAEKEVDEFVELLEHHVDESLKTRGASYLADIVKHPDFNKFPLALKKRVSSFYGLLCGKLNAVLKQVTDSDIVRYGFSLFESFPKRIIEAVIQPIKRVIHHHYEYDDDDPIPVGDETLIDYDYGVAGMDIPY